MEKEARNWRESNEGVWEDLEKKRKEENYVIVIKKKKQINSMCG